jgi:hypothetical protein
MKRSYTIPYEGREIAFTIESESEEAFKAFESRMKLVKELKTFYTNLKETRNAIHMIDNAIELSREFMTEDMLDFLDR